MTLENLVAALALIGIVIVVSALLSGLVDKSGFPQVAVFLLIGAALGPAGLGVFNMTLASPILRVVATLSLTLVLFTDAVALNTSEVKRYAGLAFRMLGPGTLLCAALTALAAWWLLHIPLAYAAVLGAALASTDERPGGARTSTSRMDQSTSAAGRLGSMAKRRVAGRVKRSWRSFRVQALACKCPNRAGMLKLEL